MPCPPPYLYGLLAISLPGSDDGVDLGRGGRGGHGQPVGSRGKRCRSRAPWSAPPRPRPAPGRPGAHEALLVAAARRRSRACPRPARSSARFARWRGRTHRRRTCRTRPGRGSAAAGFTSNPLDPSRRVRDPYEAAAASAAGIRLSAATASPVRSVLMHAGLQSLLCAYGVSCRARARRAALHGWCRDSPLRLGPPFPGRLTAKDSAMAPYGCGTIYTQGRRRMRGRAPARTRRPASAR